MFQLTVEAIFPAAHAIQIRGGLEPLHGHNWHVTVAVEGESLDDDGLLVDFHALEAMLREITGPFTNRNLNETPPFDRVNPTAEHVARHIGEEMGRALARSGDLVRLGWVRLTEAPGCAVTWFPQGMAKG